MRFSLGATVSQVATVIGVAARGISYLKDNLKVYFDFKSSRAKTLEFVGTGSTLFDGSDDYVTLDSKLNLTAACTISMWLKPDTINSYDAMLGTSDADNYLRLNTTGKINWDGASGGTTVTLSSNILQDTWNHLACVRDDSDNIYIYLNGVEVGTGTRAGTFDYNRIGNKESASYFGGNMAQIGIWERALSASEIQNIVYKTYDDLKGTEKTHLLHWYPLDSDVDSEGVTNTYKDSHGTNHGTNSGSTLKDGIYNDYSPIKPRGFDNAPTAQADLIGSGSASFTATNDDHILLASETNISSDFTIVCWMKPDSFTYEGILGGYSHSKTTFALQDADAIRFRLNKADDSSYWYVDWDCGFADWTGEWQHLAVTKEGTTLTPYLDGVKGTTGTLNGSGGVLKVQMIGGHDAANTMGNEFDGNLAQIGIFSSKLTQEQIQSIKEKSYSELSSSEKTTLVHWWGLDVNANDEHGSNNGTLS